MAEQPLLEVRGLKKYFSMGSTGLSRGRGRSRRLMTYPSTINPGETLGLVGESGCGKTTVGRTILRLYEPTAGETIFEGMDLNKLSSTSCCPIGGRCR